MNRDYSYCPLLNHSRSFPGRFCLLLLLLLAGVLCSRAQQSARQEISLNGNWLSIAGANDEALPSRYFDPALDTKNWKQVSVPHNWDSYEGYRRLLHGNRHGDSWYRREFSISRKKDRKRFFLFFEGVGSYATVFLNGKNVGEHAGGRTSFTLDVTDVIKTDGTANLLAVRAWHPSGIKDLPWVCGGCSEERGFSEGSQPMGIFRPVQLLVTDEVRIEPFGVHAWASIGDTAALLSINTTLKNYGTGTGKIEIVHQLFDRSGEKVKEWNQNTDIKAGDSLDVLKANLRVDKPSLWSVSDPCLYTIVTSIRRNGHLADQVKTPFGFRTIRWDNAGHRFFLNGEAVFLNGIAEYEHLIGQSHAFSSEQVRARINWIRMAGFNAFRDGHQPHNLLYGQLCDEKGILWWTQLSAHIWYDSPSFRANFKKLLREWVMERRNSPAVILWGLQNESKLPEDFARECTELIRQLDPTASGQRLVTTCNGGSGTDWDVPQNWTGTYGGDPDTYATDLKKQVLVGEYGAWRTLGLHTEGPFVQNGVLSEDRMTLLMEQKVRLAHSVRDSSAGHFFWLLTSHDNPGRVQGGEGLRELDRVGPVNYKGLLTPWEEPTDAFYMFRSNYVPAVQEPMVYIVSHTWPNRWLQPGIKDSIIVYSNCDEVELFNDLDGRSLGRKKRGPLGTHYQWDGVPILYNVLYAVGYVNGEPVARDTIILDHLEKAPSFYRLTGMGSRLLKPAAGYHYIYRVNCGGPSYQDGNGNSWMADRPLPVGTDQKKYWGSLSWANDFTQIPAFFASQRITKAPVGNTADWPLFQSFRYGRDRLRYSFPLPDGEYLLELYFIEPWLGIGGGMKADSMRMFDVAVNGRPVLRDLDIWKEAGTNRGLKKTVKVKIEGGQLLLSFPETKVGQALISGIAIASLKQDVVGAPSRPLISSLSEERIELSDWLNEGDRIFTGGSHLIHKLPPPLFGVNWLRYPPGAGIGLIRFIVNDSSDVFIGINSRQNELPAGLSGYENTGEEITTGDGRRYQVYRKRFSLGREVTIDLSAEPLVMIKKAADMQPAFDLKPVTSYRTDAAVYGAGLEKEKSGTRDVIMVKTPGKAELEFRI